MKLYGKLLGLAGNLSESGADLPPTDQQVAVNNELREQLANDRSQFKELTETATTGFNMLLRNSRLGIAIQP